MSSLENTNLKYTYFVNIFKSLRLFGLCAKKKKKKFNLTKNNTV